MEDVPVNNPVFPDLECYVDILKGVWDRRWVTNNGPLVQSLEIKLKKFLDVPNLILTANCTQALEMMLHGTARPDRKRIITTPFSFIATLSSIAWTGFEPVFVDIDRTSWNIDLKLLDQHLDDEIGAVLVTHLFGLPGDNGQLHELCRSRGVPLLFDGAHTFGVKTKSGSLAMGGSATALSFHATKIFGTVEGGALITGDNQLAERFRRLRTFGLDGDDYLDLGTNSKMSELHAAFGLATLESVPEVINRRQDLWRCYKNHLPEGIKLLDLETSEVIQSNYSYAIVSFHREKMVMQAQNILVKNGIHTRRYFYPALHHAHFLKKNFQQPVADEVSRRVLCLPLFADLTEATVIQICELLSKLRF